MVIPDRLLAFFSRTPSAPRGVTPRRQPRSSAATSSSMIRATTRLRLRAPAGSLCRQGQVATPAARALRHTGALPDGAPAIVRPAGGWFAADCWRNSSKTRDIVLDPFGGSGTTIIAREKSGRRARLME